MSNGEDRPPPRWDDIADWYDDRVTSKSPPQEDALAALLSLLPDAAGAVLDLACGQGVAARAVARRGHRVVGVDLSRPLLEHARRHEHAEPLGVRYQQGDVQALAGIPTSSYDGVVCNLALMDIRDLAATISETARVLRPGGWFVFTITHPCFQTPHAQNLEMADGTPARLVSRYFDETFWRSQSMGAVRRVGNYHRPLATYVSTLISNRFSLEALVEPAASEALAALSPVYAQVPAFLGARARLQEGQVGGFACG